MDINGGGPTDPDISGLSPYLVYEEDFGLIMPICPKFCYSFQRKYLQEYRTLYFHSGTKLAFNIGE